jgi:hypothetical protein
VIRLSPTRCSIILTSHSWEMLSSTLDMKRRFTDSVCRIVKAKPETTYDNFARDFGERFVPGYQPQSSVDFLVNAPFQE